MILFFDTETTGFPIPSRPIGDETQPHIVQLACILTEDDGLERACFSTIINPGVPIPEVTSRIHGITSEIAERSGISLTVAVHVFEEFLDRAHRVVAHNIKFDAALIRTAFARCRTSLRMPPQGLFCTMEAASAIIQIPPTERMLAVGITKCKPPKLSECVAHFFSEPLDGAHDALVDVRACARVYFYMQNLKAAVA